MVRQQGHIPVDGEGGAYIYSLPYLTIVSSHMCGHERIYACLAGGGGLIPYDSALRMNDGANACKFICAHAALSLRSGRVSYRNLFWGGETM